MKQSFRIGEIHYSYENKGTQFRPTLKHLSLVVSKDELTECFMDPSRWCVYVMDMAVTGVKMHIIFSNPVLNREKYAWV